MSDFTMELGRRMHARRKELGITQEMVAAACHVSKSTVCRYERGEIEAPHRPTVESIAKILRIDPDYLYGERARGELEGPAQDVRQIIAAAKAQLMRQEGLMFDGAPVSAEALRSILDAIDIGMTMAGRRMQEKA